MNFQLISPCDNCPFRTDRDFYLSPERGHEIMRGVRDQQQTFSCHKTAHFSSEEGGYDDYSPKATEQHCAGMLIMLEKINRPNQMMRIAERLGLYDRSKLKMSAPVFESFEDWIAYLERLEDQYLPSK